MGTHDIIKIPQTDFTTNPCAAIKGDNILMLESQ